MQSLRSSTTMLSRRAFSTSTPRSLARMQLIGRLGDTPEAVPTSSGRELIRYNLAVSHGKADENGKRPTSWYRIATFISEQETKRNLLLSLTKGTHLFVEADARMDSFETDNGEKRFSLNLVGRNFEILSQPLRNHERE